ncbi:HPP family protein [Xenophilus arseniciresistens]|uniref:HPP family protein n=1 Tax=Xenophilus arseniciresistens TaxID=1283306 RepID=A0AAE3SYG9_9BURK|nr:HPP family protein [Xenophilus arseniciresistens]MDA7414816.1 HPP family protein [Xenophilus arseniciresistens]
MSPPGPSASPSRLQRLRQALAALLPAVLRVDANERLRAALGAGLGLFFTALLSHSLAPEAHAQAAAWLIAPMGASAVLIFAVPASPLAQPWAVLGGNTLSALVGMACLALIPDASLAAAAAVGLAIGLMFALRCLHPPGGASALLVVLTQVQDPGFALFPVLANSLLLVLAGTVYNSLTGRPYPHRQRAAPAAPGKAAAAASRFTSADFDAALAHYNQVLDISRDDLEELLHQAELAAWHRTLGELRCEDIMSRQLVTAEFGTSLAEAWGLLQRHRIKALPVLGRGGQLIGIFTLADFVRHALSSQPRSVQGLRQRLRVLLRPSSRSHSRKPEVVGQLMNTAVSSARPDQRVVELIPLFGQGGHHHLPVVDEQQRAVGIITQSDLVRVLYRAARPD